MEQNEMFLTLYYLCLLSGELNPTQMNTHQILVRMFRGPQHKLCNDLIYATVYMSLLKIINLVAESVSTSSL